MTHAARDRALRGVLALDGISVSALVIIVARRSSSRTPAESRGLAVVSLIAVLGLGLAGSAVGTATTATDGRLPSKKAETTARLLVAGGFVVNTLGCALTLRLYRPQHATVKASWFLLIGGNLLSYLYVKYLSRPVSSKQRAQ
jgi:hypothetical protein